MTTQRRGLSLLELLICVAILGVMIGLFLPAVQNVRAAAARARSASQMKQINLATHHFAEQYGGCLPNQIALANTWGSTGLFISILPYVDGGNNYVREFWSGSSSLRVPLFISPADPSVDSQLYSGSLTSYAANAQVFRGAPHLNRTFADGTSQTMAFAERYAACGNPAVSRFAQFDLVSTTWWQGASDRGLRRATFADGGGDAALPMLADVYPVTAGNPPATRASEPGRTFQHNPAVQDADPRVVQSIHPAGLLVGFADGSVRTVKPGVSETVFWSAVTPAGGEVSVID